MAKYGKYTWNQMEALCNIVGGEENIDRMLRGEMKCTLEVVKVILAINRAQLFDPVAFIGSGWTIWRGPANGTGLRGDEQQDAHSLELANVDFTTARFETCLAEGEQVITGEQRLSRLREKEVIRADANIGAALVNEPGQTTLKWLHQTHGVTWFELPGTELRHSDGHRYFLCLYRRDGGRWNWIYSWLGGDRCAGSPALVFAK
jgi:hypothetical protein